MTGVAIAGVSVYCLFLAGLYFGQRSLLYHPDATVPVPAVHGVPEMTALRIPVGNGLDIFCWWYPPAHESNATIVYFHGNAGHIGERAYKVRPLIDAGHGVLLTTYRYNAGSGGLPSEAALIADAHRAADHVSAQGVAPERTVFYGESLGSGIAIALAAERQCGGLVLETPYSSVAEVAQGHYWYAPARWLLRDKFDSMDRIGRIRAPLLLFHGDADTTIPIRFARHLFDAAPEPKEGQFLPGGAHTNLYDFGAGRLVLDFLDRHFPGNAGKATRQ